MLDFRSTRLALLLAMWLALSACATPHRFAVPDLNQRVGVGKSVALAVLRVYIYSYDAGNKVQPVDEWSEVARANLVEKALSISARTGCSP
jgi:hypothetical protein